MEVKNEEEARLHRVIAALQLSAQQGWERYEAANNRARDLEVRLAATSCQLADFSGIIKQAVMMMHSEYTEGRVPEAQRPLYKQLMNQADDVLAMQDRKYIDLVKNIMGTHDELNKAIPLIYRMMKANREAFHILNEEHIKFFETDELRRQVDSTHSRLRRIISDAEVNEFVGDLYQFYEKK